MVRSYASLAESDPLAALQNTSMAANTFGTLECLQEFSHMHSSVSQVADAIAEARQLLQHADESCSVEIEGRLGSRDESGFRADVGKPAFESLLQLLESFPGWLSQTPWQESHDVFYTIDVPAGAAGRPLKTQVRSSVGFDEKGQLVLQHVVKRKIRVVDLRIASRMEAAPHFANHLLGTPDALAPSPRPHAEGAHSGLLLRPSHVRVGISLEQRVPEELLPVAVKPTLVRIKQRRRFLLSSLGLETAAFAVDMTICYSGKSKSEAEQRQASAQDSSYEVEVECLEPLAYLRSCNQQESMLALSLLMKLHDFAAALNSDAAVAFVRCTAQQSC